MKLFYVETAQTTSQLAKLSTDIDALSLRPELIKVTEKIGQKWLKTAPQGSLLLDQNGQLSLIITNSPSAMKVTPNWQAMQHRIVTAGKKTELLLKAAKLQADMQVIDATAGFGHDSLILASTGAQVAMIEQHPLVYLLLKNEIRLMANHPKWQKLIQRLKLYFGDALTVINQLNPADCIYLDPMFPQDSYKSSVGKTMQALHELTYPPSLQQEYQLLDLAKHHILLNGRVIVKRPKNAPFLANISPNEQLTNDIIRFDCY